MNETQETDEEVYQAAAEWLEKMACRPLDHLSKRRFQQWMKDERHKVIFESMTDTWVSDELETGLKKVKFKGNTFASFWRIDQFPLAMAVASCLVLGLVLLFNSELNFVSKQEPLMSPKHFSSKFSEQKRVTLEDGSHLDVGPSAHLMVAISDSQRSVSLDKGATYFKVASDTQRPFKVKVGEASVVAVGTEFNIDRGQGRIIVTVHEGAVEVRGTDSSMPVLLKAAEQAEIKDNVIGPLVEIDLSRHLDWRSGWMELDDQPLFYLIERINRRRADPISIKDSELSNLPVAGRFRLQDGDQVLAMLEALYPLKVVSENGVTEIQSL